MTGVLYKAEPESKLFDEVFDILADEASLHLWGFFNHEDPAGYTEVIKQAFNSVFVVDVNERAEEWAKENAGELVRGIDAQAQRAVQRITSRGIKYGWSDEELATALAPKVGLDERFADAVENYRQRLVDGGVPPGDARRQARRYADELRWRRASRIARTEVQKALVEAQREIWKEAIELGDLPRSVRRQWVLHKTERTCKVCRGLNGKTAAFEGNYRSGITSPPVHPNCRCTERLVLPGGIAIPGSAVIEKHRQRGAKGRWVDHHPDIKPKKARRGRGVGGGGVEAGRIIRTGIRDPNTGERLSNSDVGSIGEKYFVNLVGKKIAPALKKAFAGNRINTDVIVDEAQGGTSAIDIYVGDRGKKKQHIGIELKTYNELTFDKIKLNSADRKYQSAEENGSFLLVVLQLYNPEEQTMSVYMGEPNKLQGFRVKTKEPVAKLRVTNREWAKARKDANLKRDR